MLFVSRVSGQGHELPGWLRNTVELGVIRESSLSPGSPVKPHYASLLPRSELSTMAHRLASVSKQNSEMYFSGYKMKYMDLTTLKVAQ
jgi:hypothetical protein